MLCIISVKFSIFYDFRTTKLTEKHFVHVPCTDIVRTYT